MLVPKAFCLENEESRSWILWGSFIVSALRRDVRARWPQPTPSRPKQRRYGGREKANAAECPVCTELYEPEGSQMPYVLHCAHTLCQACTIGIKAMDNKTGASFWRCPSCQAVTTREPEPKRLLITNILLAHLLCWGTAPPRCLH